VTDTDLITADSGTGASASGKTGSLTTMVLPELRALAVQAGVKGTSGMRKSELIAAIRESRDGGARNSGHEERPAQRSTGARSEESAEPAAAKAAAERGAAKAAAERGEAKAAAERGEAKSPEAKAPNARAKDSVERGEAKAGEAVATEAAPGGAEVGGAGAGAKKNPQREATEGRERREPRGESREGADTGGDAAGGRGDRDEDGDGRGGRRGRRFRDRRRRGERPEGGGNESELREDDVVQPVAGILDVLDNYAFVRTSGYLAGPNDVYVSMNLVRKNGLRRGDAVTGAVRVSRDGEAGGQNQRQKFNPLVRLDSVNGGPVEAARNRPEFSKLTPLYPNQRLRLETTPDRLTTRVIDLIMPIGKGQRALIVSPPKAGKTTIMQDIANAITKNNPECHLMVVLVDERPEEVTDMQRSVIGEVIASTFDRPPSDHTQAAELAIERAKRLVEQGKDVVVLLDSITRLGRAYNNASPASGRILSGGVDSTALYPPKRFLGAARNIEFGGSLTIIATAMVETGSTGDTVIFEEFKGTGNAELKLDRKIAERRVFPAVDVNPSGTRKDELLLSPDEFSVVHKLRRVLSGLDSHQAIDLLMSQLRKTKTNYEFLVQVSKTAPGSADSD
jgi:transcription termination factor Rho